MFPNLFVRTSFSNHATAGEGIRTSSLSVPYLSPLHFPGVTRKDLEVDESGNMLGILLTPEYLIRERGSKS